MAAMVTVMATLMLLMVKIPTTALVITVVLQRQSITFTWVQIQAVIFLNKDGYDNVNDVEEGSTVTLNIVKNENSEAVDYIVTKVSFSFINGIDYEYIDVPVTVDHTNNQISFTMPDKDVSVSAEIISVFEKVNFSTVRKYPKFLSSY